MATQTKHLIKPGPYDVLMERRPDDIEIWVSAEPDHISVDQEARSIGGGKHGEDFVRAAKSLVRHHGRWGWCTIIVRAIMGHVEGSASLGCCSYKSAWDFKEGGFYEQMCEEAVTDLRENLKSDIVWGSPASPSN